MKGSLQTALAGCDGRGGAVRYLRRHNAGCGAGEVVVDDHDLDAVPAAVALPEPRQRMLDGRHRTVHSAQMVQHRHAHDCANGHGSRSELQLLDWCFESTTQRVRRLHFSEHDSTRCSDNQRPLIAHGCGRQQVWRPTYGAARALAAWATAAALGHVTLHEAQHFQAEAALGAAAQRRGALSILSKSNITFCCLSVAGLWPK